MHHDVYRPRYHVRASQDEGPQASWKSMFRHSDEVLHITRPGQAVLVSGCAAVDGIGLMIALATAAD
jgi:hypothetical protein